MYELPTIVETTIFARYPKELQNASDDNNWLVTQPLGTHMPARSLLEGPSFDKEGNLWCVDVMNGRILTVDPLGEFKVVSQYDGWPNGLKIHRDGRVFVADHKNGLMIVDPVNGRVEPYLTRCGDKAFRGLNDLFFASNGDLYFTDQGLSGLHEPNGRLFRLRDNGDLTCLLDNVPSPNGLVMNATETAIMLAVTRANAVWRAPFTRDGDLAKVGNFIQLSGGVGPDGLALDVQGRLAIAHPGAGIVWVFDAAGVPIHRVRCCVGNHPTNVAFGGPDNRFLFITETASATIQKAEMDVPGNAMFSA